MTGVPHMKFVWNIELDLPEAEMEGGSELLKEFLQSELQGDARTCDRLIRKINDGASFHINGNMSTLKMNAGTISLEALFDENLLPVNMTNSDFLTIIKRWKSFIAAR